MSDAPCWRNECKFTKGKRERNASYLQKCLFATNKTYRFVFSVPKSIRKTHSSARLVYRSTNTYSCILWMSSYYWPHRDPRTEFEQLLCTGMGILRIFLDSQCRTLNGHISITHDCMRSWPNYGGCEVKLAVSPQKLVGFFFQNLSPSLFVVWLFKRQDTMVKEKGIKIYEFVHPTRSWVKGCQTSVKWRKFRKKEMFFPSNFRIYSAIDNRTQYIALWAPEQCFH